MKNSNLLSILLELDLSLETNGGGTDKEFPKRYISLVYDRLLSNMQNLPITIIEIGVRTGASAKLFSSYFSVSNYYGVDNGTDVVWQNEDWLKGKNLKLIFADAYNSEIFSLLPSKVDIIIDDGPHSLISQQWAALNYASILKRNGFLFIEDIQGGIRFCDQIIRNRSKSFEGCIRIFDLRKISGQGDAIILMFHNCGNSCNLNIDNRNELNFLNSLRRVTHSSAISYNLLRLLSRCKFKILRITREIKPWWNRQFGKRG